MYFHYSWPADGDLRAATIESRDFFTHHDAMRASSPGWESPRATAIRQALPSTKGQDRMRCRLGCRLTYDLPQPTPMIALLNVHFSRFGDLDLIFHSDPGSRIRGIWQTTHCNVSQTIDEPNSRLLRL